MSFQITVDGVLNQAQLRNGYTRPMHHTIPRPSSKQQSSGVVTSYMHQNQQSPQQNPNFSMNSLPYAFQNMNIIGMNMEQPTTIGTMHHHKSTGSDSGSSVASGEISPPETPILQQSNVGSNVRENRRGMSRGINGRQQQQQEKSQGDNRGQQTGSVIYATSSPHGGASELLVTTSSNVGNSNLISSNSQNNLQQLAGSTTSGTSVIVNSVLLPSHLQSANAGTPPQFATSGFPTSAYHPAVHRSLGAPVTTATAFRHPTQAAFAPLQTNDATQLLYIPTNALQFIQPTVPPPSGTPSVTSNIRSSPSLQTPTVSAVPALLTNSSAYPTNKLNQSCFNCGSTSHTGRECSESSMEDVTRNTIYKLDYTTLQQANQSVTTTVVVVSPTQSTTSSGTSATSTSSSSSLAATTTATQSSTNNTQQQTSSVIPKIKPHFNPDIVPQSSIDQPEIINLISSDSSSGSGTNSK